MTDVEIADADRIARMVACVHPRAARFHDGGTLACRFCEQRGIEVAYAPNPWAGRLVCSKCNSSEWTLPYDPTVPDSSWRCCACHCWVSGPMGRQS